MGYMRHHAILVSGWEEELVLAAHERAVELWSASLEQHTEYFPRLVSEPAGEAMNGYWSFAIFPDGSKEGWSHSDLGDELRARFIEYLRTLTYEDGSLHLNWVEVQYGDDENETRIVHSSDDDDMLVRTEVVGTIS